METNTAPNTVLVGFEKLQNYLEKKSNSFDAIKIANAVNDSKNFRVEFSDSKIAEDNILELIEYLETWAPKNKSKNFWICLFKNNKQVERFPFSKISDEVATSSVGNVDSAMVQQLIDANVRAALAEKHLDQLAAQQLEDEDEDEDEQPDYIGAIMPMITPHIPALMQGLIAKFAVNEPLAVNGVEDLPGEAIEVVKSLMAKGVTVEHLKKLNAMPAAKVKSLLLML
jgi:hypothetical protein